MIAVQLERRPAALIVLIADQQRNQTPLSAQGFELTKYGRAIANTNANLTPLVIAGFCYLLITLPLSMVVRRMEARQKKER